MLYGREVRLRALEYEDLKDVWRWQNDLDVMRQLWIEPVSLRALQDEYARELDNEKYKRFIIEHLADGRAIGLIWYYSLVPHKSCELGIYIGEPDAIGRGYGPDAITRFLEYLFYVKGVHRVGLSLSDDNTRARSAYEKCGFRHEGTTREWAYMDGGWVDLLNMGILRREFDELHGSGATT